MYNSNDKTSYSFYCEVNQNSPYWTLAKYFQDLDNGNSKDLILSAVNAYWQPMAAQYGGKDTSCVKQITINCIYQLQQQIHDLQSLELELLPLRGLINSAQKQETIPFEIKRYRFNPDSRYGLVLNYFQSSQSTFTEEQMIFWSSSAYWQPLAKRHLGLCQSEPDWLSVISESVKRIQKHIEYLQVTNDVNLQLLGVGDCQANQSLSNSVISFSSNKKESQTAQDDGNLPVPSSLTQTSEAIKESESENQQPSSQTEQPINWIEQIDDPLLKPQPDDKLIDKMFG